MRNYTCYFCEPCGLEWCTLKPNRLVQSCPRCDSDDIYISDMTDKVHKMSYEELSKYLVEE